MSYAVFFDKNNETIRLPVNPESIKIEKGQAVETYDVLKLGKISIAAAAELDKYSFEAELPGKRYRYVVTSGDFKPADFYLNKFKEWMEAKEPVRFIKNNGEGDDLSTLVLIESLDISENAGEEGDYIVGFKLTEYKPYGKKEIFVSGQSTASTQQAVSTTPPAREGKPSTPKTYTVASGDTLWGIAKRFLGDGSKYPQLVKLNPGIKNPALIRVGQVISLA
jgi:nucleoid-associated protein YgaU